MPAASCACAGLANAAPKTVKRTAAIAAVALDIVGPVRTLLIKTLPGGPFEQMFPSVTANTREAMSKRSRHLGLVIIIALAVMIGLIAWAYTVAEHKIR